MDWPNAAVAMTIIAGLFPIVYKLLPSKKITTIHRESSTVNFDAEISAFKERFRGIDEKIDDLKETLTNNYNFLLQEIRSLRK